MLYRSEMSKSVVENGFWFICSAALLQKLNGQITAVLINGLLQIFKALINYLLTINKPIRYNLQTICKELQRS